VKRIAGFDDLIGRARRRYVANLYLKQGVNAACAAMGGVILLLILGVQVMDWRWLAGLAAAGIAAGFGAVKRQAPSRYAISQVIDRNLSLHDSLSTAFFYNRMGEQRGPREMRAAQFAEAERLARRADIERAVPFSTPRSVYVMAVLGLIATGLLGLRYGITRSLDLHAPLAAMLLNALGRDAQPPEERKQDQQRYQQLISQLGLTQEDSSAARKAAGSKQSASSANAEAQKEQKSLEKNGGQQSAGSAEAENMRQNREQSAAQSAQNSGQQGERRTGAQQSSSSQSQQQLASTQQHENSSLMDKLRDAVSSLMSRFDAQPQQGESQQMAENSQSRPGEGNNQQSGESGRQKSESGQKQQQSADSGKQGAQGQGQPQQGEPGQMAQAGGNRSKGDDSDASKQPGSGIGSRDGDKAIRQAEQLAAMGRISQIIGRRSQSLTGDATIEVASSGTQNLRTGYTQQNAAHTDSGGEISRDEIPLAYQRFVQKYFEQVRKQPGPVKKQE
jgi:hypothetical protein